MERREKVCWSKVINLDPAPKTINTSLRKKITQIPASTDKMFKNSSSSFSQFPGEPADIYTLSKDFFGSELPCVILFPKISLLKG